MCAWTSPLTGCGLLGCQVETECRQSELSTAEREQTLRLKSRAVELLPEGPANLTKLQVGLVLDCHRGSGSQKHSA